MSTGINIKKKLAILDEGASVATDATSIDFVGSGVNASTIDGDVTITIPGGSGNTTYYLNQTVDQAPYKEFSSIVASAVEQVIPLTVLAGATSVIAEYQTPSNIPGTTQIPGGLWQFFLHFNAVAAGQNWIIRPTVYKRDLGGTETLIFTPDPEIVTGMSTTTTMYVSDGVFPTTTILTTDRIVVRLSMQNTRGVSQTVNFRTEGSQHYSVGLTTLNQVIPTGAVSSVTGTAPIVSSGGTTPAISIAQADALTDGYLSSSDFAVFDAKVPATRSIKINGTTLDFSADRTWTVGDIVSSGSYADPSWITSLAYSKLTGTPTIPVVTPSALTKTDDTNVTLTLGGSPSTALLAATSLTLGWTGTLADTRITSASTWNAKQNAISLTTTGSSGASTFITNTLNVPTYTLSGLGGVPSSRSITINGTTLDLSADRTWNVGTVTSVAALTLGTTGTDLTSSVATGTTTPVITLNVPTASASNRGALSSTDWTTFNGKADGSGTINYVSKFTGTGTLGNSNIFDNGTNVGIGTITPAKLLDVNGDALINGHTVGRGGGNVATNTVAGLQAGFANTTGSSNSFFGSSSGRFNTTGTNLSSIGVASLYNNTTGSDNVGLGLHTLFSNVTGSNNTSAGNFAGRFLNNGSSANTTPENSVFLGYSTRSLTNNDTNQIVIGYLALGKGSNTVQLGNTSITNTYLQGDVETPGNFLLGANAKYLYGKNSSGVSTRMIGINGSNAFYIGSIDANVTAINFNINGTNVFNVDNTGLITTKNYTLPLAAPTAGQVLGYLSAGTTTWVSGSSSGIWGIANSSGVYTYYATYQLAVAAAVAGQTIEMFGSQTESIANHILKTGVNINYNGYTLTFLTGCGIIDNGVACEVQLLNGEIKKGVSGQIAIYISSSSTILRGNVLVNSSLAGTGGTGSYGYYGIGKVYGLNFKGNDCVAGFAALGDIFNVTVNCTSGAAVASLASLINSTINSTSTTGSAIASVPLVDGSNIKTNGAGGYVNSGVGIVNNSTFYSLTSRIIDGQQNGLTFNNCSFNSRASTVYNFGGGFGDSVFNNCTLRSLVYINNYASGGNMNNCTVVSETDICLYFTSGTFVDNNFTSLLNSASGRIAQELGDGTRFTGNTFNVTSSSAVALYSTGTPTVYISGNNLKGSSNLKSAGIVNGQTNTADAQGNTILQ